MTTPSLQPLTCRLLPTQQHHLGSTHPQESLPSPTASSINRPLHTGQAIITNSSPQSTTIRPQAPSANQLHRCTHPHHHQCGATTTSSLFPTGAPPTSQHLPHHSRLQSCLITNHRSHRQTMHRAAHHDPPRCPSQSATQRSGSR